MRRGPGRSLCCAGSGGRWGTPPGGAVEVRRSPAELSTGISAADCVRLLSQSEGWPLRRERAAVVCLVPSPWRARRRSGVRGWAQAEVWLSAERGAQGTAGGGGHELDGGPSGQGMGRGSAARREPDFGAAGTGDCAWPGACCDAGADDGCGAGAVPANVRGAARSGVPERMLGKNRRAAPVVGFRRAHGRAGRATSAGWRP